MPIPAPGEAVDRLRQVYGQDRQRLPRHRRIPLSRGSDSLRTAPSRYARVVQRFILRVGIPDEFPAAAWRTMREVYPQVDERVVRAKLTPGGPTETAKRILLGWL
jgi:hypothetical protein